MAKYQDYNDIFSLELIIKFFKNIKINKNIIELLKSKQPLYKAIYTLSLGEFEILKIYIETYLKTKFIQLFKSLASAFILFNKKLDNNFCLYINY